MTDSHIFYLTRGEFLSLVKLDDRQLIKGKDAYHYLKKNEENDAFLIRFTKPYMGVLEYIPYDQPIEAFVFDFLDRGADGSMI